jgi:MerR family mercuric resistance operon transcriptional regulator
MVEDEEMPELTIGQVAKAARVNIETLRYYERCGLLEPPMRSESNYRRYPKDTSRIVLFIKRVQELGFTLKEVRELLSLRNAPAAQSKEIKELARIKLVDINARIETLQKMSAALAKLVSQCNGVGTVDQCAILQAIESEDTF